jgi:hypothetical protein
MKINNPVLVIGNANAKHLWRFAHFYKLNESKEIDILNTGAHCYNKKIEFDNVYEINRSGRISKFNVILNDFKLSWRLYKLIIKKHFSLINIHSVGPNSILFLPIAKLFSIPVLLSPWGSDVYRISSFNKYILKFVYQNTSYISFGNNDFKENIKKIFGVNQDRFVYIPFGSEIIEFININRTKKKGDILRELKLPQNAFVITCGYTANIAQRHKEMISAISEIKKKLPVNTLLIFPLTYGPEKGSVYIDEIKELVIDNELNAVFFTEYLEPYEIALLRLVSNIFIHIQPTDAFSASLQEYILAGGICINGAWLKYPSLEVYGYPYIVLDDLQNLKSVLLSIINQEKELPSINPILINEIKSRSWDNAIHLWIDFYKKY